MPFRYVATKAISHPLHDADAEGPRDWEELPHTLSDKTVPHPVIESYLGAFKHVKSVTSRCIAGADHALSDERSRQAHGMLLVSWMTEMTLGARAASGLLRPAPGSPA